MISINTMLEIVALYSKEIKNQRLPIEIALAGTGEVGELYTEISIHYGSYKEPSEDGILGEAIDAFNIFADAQFMTGNFNLFNDNEASKLLLKKNEQNISFWYHYSQIAILQGMIVEKILDNDDFLWDTKNILNHLYSIMLATGSSGDEIKNKLIKKLEKWKKHYS